MTSPQFTLKRIFHPTDFSRPSLVAFVHALKLALEAKAELRIMHVGMAKSSWGVFPQIRETLARWGILAPGSAKNEISKLGLQVVKIQAIGRDPVKSILRELENKPADFVVLATHQRRGFARWMNEAIAEPISLSSGVMTLFVPPKCDGFVSLQDGSVKLRHIVLPVSRVPSPRSAINAVIGFSQLVKSLNVSCDLMHVGTRGDMPTLDLPDSIGLNWTETVQEGDIVEQILKSADEQSADLIAMATQGQKGFLDALRGSTTERLVREALCPVLAITASS